MLPVAGELRPRLSSGEARIGHWQLVLKHGDLAEKKNGKKEIWEVAWDNYR